MSDNAALVWMIGMMCVVAVIAIGSCSYIAGECVSAGGTWSNGAMTCVRLR